MIAKNCVITGATSGIGKIAAIALADAEVNLFLVGRNRQAGSELVRKLRRRVSEPIFEFVRADLSCQADVRSLASEIIRSWKHVDILINNAGARNDAYQETSDGLELTFAANHLGHFLLTNLLIERLSVAPAARVITVGSNAHLGGSADDGWYFNRSNYDRRRAYAKSKLANIMFAYELARRLQGTRVTSNAIDPGLVATNFARNNGLVSWLKHLVSSALRRQLILPSQGAETLVYLALSSEVAGVTGKYFYRNHEVKSSPAAYDLEEASRLWDLSARLTSIHA